MNDAHWHLAINHIPSVVLLTGTIILLGGLVFKNRSVNRTALVVIIFSGLFTIPAFLSGEGAEEVIEETLPATKELIHEHEEFGEKVLWTTIGVALLALIALISDLRGHRTFIWLFLTLFAALINTGFFAIVNNSGGEISHPEIRSDFTIPAAERDEDSH